MASFLDPFTKLASLASSYWIPTSNQKLQDAENQILQRINKPWQGNFVKICDGVEIWTLMVNREATSKHPPLVLIHGFISGVCWWVQNYNALSERHTVYAIDLPGFGRSSRPDFPPEPEKAEEQFVDYLEAWRQAVGLEKFIILGHSLGGYLVTAYALKHPERVHHLILSDPWGFSILPYGLVDRHPDNAFNYQKLPIWIRIGNYFTNVMNFLSPIRIFGPLGPWLVTLARFDPNKKKSELWKDGIVFEYIYHCNAQTPTGENAFRSMNFLLAWAKCPMIKRIRYLDQNVPISIMYGAGTFLDHRTAYEVKCIRPESTVDIYIVKNAGHDIHVDNAEEFNHIMTEILEKSCKNREEDEWMGIEKIDDISEL